MRLLPRLGGTDGSGIFLQRFEGNLTILPNRPSILDYLSIFTDPNEVRLEKFIKDGELRTWPALTMISNRMKIEKLLMQIRSTVPSPFPRRAYQKMRASSMQPC